MKVLILDGCHGTGTTTHADRLADALDGRLWTPRTPVVARAYHHPPHPDGLAGAARIAWYAGARAQMLAGGHLPDVLVMDRGPQSGLCYAESLLPGTLNRAEAIACAHAEIAAFGRTARMAVLNAPDDVLDARIAARGEDPTQSHAERRVWAQLLALHPTATVVRTDLDADEVAADLLAWALAALEVQSCTIDQLTARYAAGYSLEALSALARMSVSTLRRRLRDAGVVMRPAHRRAVVLPANVLERVRDLRAGGASLATCASVAGVSAPTVAKLMREAAS